MQDATDLLSQIWDNHEITLEGVQKRTTFGVTTTPARTVMGSVKAGARVVMNQAGEDVIVMATVRWRGDGPLPSPGDRITLPPQFGLKPGREVVTAQRIDSGTGLTPTRVEVTLK